MKISTPHKSWLILMPLLVVLAGCAGNGMQQSTGEYIDDSAITAKVKAAFVSDPQVAANEIKVTTFNGTVQLSGFAASQQEIDRAVELARNVEGVRTVKNDIRHTPESAGEYLDDSVITAKVKSALLADSLVSALDIKVETFGGVVQLSGFADNRQEIDRAGELARQIKNVKSVQNNIQIKSSSQGS